MFSFVEIVWDITRLNMHVNDIVITMITPR